MIPNLFQLKLHRENCSQRPSVCLPDWTKLHCQHCPSGKVSRSTVAGAIRDWERGCHRMAFCTLVPSLVSLTVASLVPASTPWEHLAFLLNPELELGYDKAAHSRLGLPLCSLAVVFSFLPFFQWYGCVLQGSQYSVSSGCSRCTLCDGTLSYCWVEAEFWAGNITQFRNWGNLKLYCVSQLKGSSFFHFMVSVAFKWVVSWFIIETVCSDQVSGGYL